MYSKKAIHESRYLRQARSSDQYVDLPRYALLLPHGCDINHIFLYHIRQELVSANFILSEVPLPDHSSMLSSPGSDRQVTSVPRSVRSEPVPEQPEALHLHWNYPPLHE